MSLPEELPVIELERLRMARADVTVLDVRDEDELAIAALDGALHVPMNEVPSRLAELPRDGPIVVFCHSGGRSAHVAAYLRRNGFSDVANLHGGIDAWSREIDPTIPRY